MMTEGQETYILYRVLFIPNMVNTYFQLERSCANIHCSGCLKRKSDCCGPKEYSILILRHNMFPYSHCNPPGLQGLGGEKG